MNTRRDFLRKAGSFTATLASGVTLIAFGETPAKARAADEAASSKVRWGMLIHVSKCSDGCDACVSACSAENGWQDTETL